MKLTVDRFEGKYAVVELEGGECENIAVSLLPEGVREGDVLSIEIDKTETDKRKHKIENLMDKLFEE